MDDKNRSRHISLSVGCPQEDGSMGHAAFRVEDGKHICDCGKDFTEEAKELYYALGTSLQIEE